MVRNIGRNAIRDNNGDGRALEVIVLRTDKGAVGWGHAGTGGVSALAGLDGIGDLLGRTVAELFDPEHGVRDERALVIDIPLHDLAGRILGIPVHAMLGGHGSTSVSCYSGGIYFDDLDPRDAPQGLDAIRRELRQDHDLGFRDFKLKVGRGKRWMPPAAGLDRDIEVTRLARELFPEARILVDGNDGFSQREVRQYLRAVGDCRLHWLEEPFPEGRESFAWLRQVIAEHSPGTLIADGESAPDAELIAGLATSSLLDVALMDVVGFGFTKWRAAMPALAAVGTSASPHTWGSPLKTHYAAHLAAGAGNIDTIEGMPGRLAGVRTHGPGLVDGMMHVSDEPGFGLELAS
ncbi:MAG: mandelate racemase/muconate lactonizing enzyme family protein [Protaetiibacter sp.]